MNNKDDSVRIYGICWSQLYLFLNSTIFSTILTNCSEIGPLYMTYIHIRSWCAYIRRGTLGRERPGLGKITLKTWNSDLFCNSAMELILLILKMASGYPLATFLHERCTANRSRTMFTWWCWCPNVVALFEQLLRLYLPIHARTLSVPCTDKNTCHFIRTLHITLSKV